MKSPDQIKYCRFQWRPPIRSNTAWRLGCPFQFALDCEWMKSPLLLSFHARQAYNPFLKEKSHQSCFQIGHDDEWAIATFLRFISSSHSWTRFVWPALNSQLLSWSNNKIVFCDRQPYLPNRSFLLLFLLLLLHKMAGQEMDMEQKCFAQS